MAKIFATISLLLLSAVAVTGPAYAYLDPGTGSLLLQGIIGGIAAGAAVISMNFARFKFWLRRMFRKSTDSTGK